eukprot:767157-Hanusia_phi.AAC.4
MMISLVSVRTTCRVVSEVQTRRSKGTAQQGGIGRESNGIAGRVTRSWAEERKGGATGLLSRKTL